MTKRSLNERERDEEEDDGKKRVFVGDCRERKGVLNSNKGSSPKEYTLCCQADDCESKLGAEKRYHQRHKVCEHHAKAAAVLVGGVEQRFHELSQFDDTKRSCRKRLADHNERRRKISAEPQLDDAELIPAVLKPKVSWRPKSHLEGKKKTLVIKIALPKNPKFKHFQIK
ncbi:squamosa promoter-binding protein 1-like [Tasmannia lanceolata]|uniref:squamosa promoter-binding protein 1-like n=1 Tax=Tasmannia lanceolata TaxID=3420 RepID=UPI0040628790